MKKTITRAQMKEIDDCIYDYAELNRLLERYAGIFARPYIAYSYFDENDDYLGNSDANDIMVLLENANVEVEDT